ncbi:transcriptional regulator, TetR family [Agromyces sp. CF514]|uniref:TetR/AcrR family transcriptional regulator n=1 Tax=Agromyces sp. CF514 TaxID=1881031 RepID=UPI0008F1E8C3|nr:TetR/AcrR family transcriptional regulator [Agromyces sp. CF514]SFR68348.1 transcriptional regulator, TetR family [Agromyces sp. CF514]
MSNERAGLRLAPDERRRRLLEVAGAHFRERGYDDASVSDIAKEAGVTRALMYHYFPGKEALLEGVLRAEAAEVLAETEPSPELSARANLERAVHAFLDRYAASSGAVRQLYAPQPMSPSVVWGITAANHEVQVARILASLGRADTPRLRVAVGGWLAFVEQAGRSAVAASDLDRAEVVRMCLEVLEVAVGVSPAELDRPTPAPGI